MTKYIYTALLLFINSCLFSQSDNDIFYHKPFSIYKPLGQVVISGALNNYVYSDYYGKDVKKQGYTDPHAKPEYLIYELFKDMKNKDIAGIRNLYDSSFTGKEADANGMAALLKDYTDIKYLSKFKSGNAMIIRYDFVSPQKQYAFFAALRRIDNKYYLTQDINVSDPFNVIGSFSPYNLFERTEESVRTGNMTAFYFINRDNKVFVTNDLPNEDYAAVYLAFEFYNSSSSAPEIDLLKQLQGAAQSDDSIKMKGLLTNTDWPLLSDPYFGNYYYFDIQKIFKNYPIIEPLAGIKTTEGKVLYFKYSASGQSANIASIIVKQSEGRNYLTLRIADDNINNILQNVYIQEAIYDYFKSRH
jgi:hypothetical protein